MRRTVVGLAILVCFLALSPMGWAQTQQSESGRKIATKVIPSYPQLARTMNLNGTVRLEVAVLANGSIKGVQVKGGNPLLAQAALDAVRAWKWERADHETTEFVEFKFAP